MLASFTSEGTILVSECDRPTTQPHNHTTTQPPLPNWQKWIKLEWNHVHSETRVFKSFLFLYQFGDSKSIPDSAPPPLSVFLSPICLSGKEKENCHKSFVWDQFDHSQEPVWPDNGIKSGPIFPKVTTAVFTFQNCPISHQIFGLLL